MDNKAPPNSTEPLQEPSDVQPWDDMVIGERLGPVPYRIKPSTHARHCHLLNFHHPWFETNWYLFPWELGAWARAASKYYGQLKHTVQTGFKYEFFHPARVGDPLATTWMLLEKVERRDKRYFSSATETLDEAGMVLARITTEGIDLRGHGAKLDPDVERRSLPGWDDMGEDVWASRDMADGTILLTRTRGPLPMRVSGFTRGGWDRNKWKDSIHQAGYARSMGFKEAIVEGPIVWEYGLLDLLMDFFGPESLFTSGVVSVNVRKPGYVGDVLVGKARVREKVQESGGERIVLETRIEKLNGELINVGTASALAR